MKYYYFVSYICQDEFGRMNFGNFTFDASIKLRTKEDTDLVVKEIEKSGVNKITLMSVNLLGTEEIL